MAWVIRTNSTQESWTGIASDSTGTKLCACTSNNYIYTSTNSGLTWTPNTNYAKYYWTGIASDSTGTNLCAINIGTDYSGGGLWTSNDSGLTWTLQTGNSIPINGTWSAIASSSNGQKICACINNSI